VDSTRATGAALGGTDPVTSFEEEEPQEENGFVNRVASELHPAAPMARTATAIARGNDRERNNATTENMLDSLIRNKLVSELTRCR
jgi:hypothetical protein